MGLDYLVGYIAVVGTLACAMGCGDLPPRPTMAVSLATAAAWVFLIAA